MSDMWWNENLIKLACFLADNIDLNIYLTCYDQTDYIASILEEYKKDLKYSLNKNKNV